VKGWRVAHLTTVDMSLELLLGAQLDAVIAGGGEAIGISAPGPFVGRLAARGVRFIAINTSTRGSNPLADLRAAAELWRVLRRERPTVLHTHNPKPGVYGRVIGRLAGVPIVVNTVHGLYATPDDPLAKRIVVYAAEAFASRWSDAELLQNIEDVGVMRRWRLASQRKVIHLGNGVDVERFRPGALSPDERRQVRQRWGASDATVVVGTVGRLVAEKGYPELFDAIAGLAPGVRLIVIGGDDPAKRDALDSGSLARADAAGVVRLGHRDDVDRLLGAFDVFALASHREGQPRAAMEAAATGLPIIATDIRGCRQVVEHDVSGLLVPVGDATALRTAIERLARAPEMARAMGAAGRRKAVREFDEREVVRRVLAAYAAVAARKGLTPALARPG
jgi:glycosyltransferase involved in cell wall biosynthesis